MTTTPTLFLAEQQANTTDTGSPGSTQEGQQIIGLADGSFVALWESDTDGGPDGNESGTDIIGQRYDAEGNKVGGEFRANQGFFADDEGDFTAAALPNGGFVLAFEDTDGAGTAIRYTTFDAAGALVTSGTIAGDPGAPVIGSPSISVNPDGSFLVAYQQTNSGTNQTATLATIVNSAGTAGTPFTLLSGGLSTEVFTQQVDVTTLTNGNHVIVARAVSGDDGLYMRIVDPTGGNVLGFTEVASTLGDGEFDIDPTVTALSGGGFVVAWTNTDVSDTDVLFQMYSAAGVPVGTPKSVASGGSTDNTNEAEVVGLSDGGFVVVYDDDETNTIRLQRFDSSGISVGSEVVVTASDSQQTPTISLTDDGRLLVGWTSVAADRDVEFAIFDPRETSFAGSGGNDTITSRQDGATVSGLAGDDTLLGQAGGDRLIGGDGSDEIRGRGGDDLLEGGLNADTIFGDDGNDTLFANTLANPDGSTVGDALSGGAGNDTITGSAGDDVLNGNLDNDTLTGGGGADTLLGAAGNDTLVFDAGDLAAGERADGGTGDDRALVQGTVNLASLGTLFANFEEIEFDASLSEAKTVTLRADQIGSGLAVDAVIDGALTGFADVLRIKMGAVTSMDISTFQFQDWNPATGERDRVFILGDGSAETIVGSTQRDTINGGDGDDTLSGGGRKDKLIGGEGDDTFIVNRNGEAVEAAGQGTDLVRSGISYVLGASIENLKLTGVAGSNGTGNDLGNTIKGNGSANILNGREGFDTLTGGSGADKFVFDTALGPTNVDKITDFSTADDRIRLDDAIFDELTVGNLAGSAFHKGASAADASDRIIYNAATGSLFYDEDGVGGADQIRFARLDTGLNLGANDFVVF